MPLPDTFDAYYWITSKVAYGRDLQSESYQTVASLAVLCAYFEEEYGHNGAGKAVFRECADRAAARLNGGLPPELLEALAYWRTRYVDLGHFTPNYRTIVWRKNEDVATVEAVLMGQTKTASDEIMALLTITYRLRNNLFHGLKGIGELNGQRQNLAVACMALSAVMELL
jgi:hypothetical protein